MILVSRDDMYMLSGCELIDTENISLHKKKTMNITIKGKMQQS
jgi:uncharacterized protein YabE (DUF348 family)